MVNKYISFLIIKIYFKGKRQLLIEEIQKTEIGEDGGKGPPTVRSSGTYRLSVFEDGKEIGTHEADIQLPENIV